MNTTFKYKVGDIIFCKPDLIGKIIRLNEGFRCYTVRWRDWSGLHDQSIGFIEKDCKNITSKLARLFYL